MHPAHPARIALSSLSHAPMTGKRHRQRVAPKKGQTVAPKIVLEAIVEGADEWRVSPFLRNVSEGDCL
ncbi:hypothetical protein NTCA1_13280 [Novosphingobium sp. TCA1]|nr:hypothetical protein NTCA1_13280 [Novosphingobium sp. TCA1]